MRETSELDDAMSRPVNKIGSTAAEFMVGDLDSALNRDPSPAKNLLRKLNGMAPMPIGSGS
jgi:hypothetical protein